MAGSRYEWFDANRRESLHILKASSSRDSTGKSYEYGRALRGCVGGMEWSPLASHTSYRLFILCSRRLAQIHLRRSHVRKRNDPCSVFNILIHRVSIIQASEALVQSSFQNCVVFIVLSDRPDDAHFVLVGNHLARTRGKFVESAPDFRLYGDVVFWVGLDLELRGQIRVFVRLV